MPADPTPAAASQARILVVDDTEDNLFLMTAVLEDQDQVSLAASGVDALRLAASAEAGASLPARAGHFDAWPADEWPRLPCAARP